MKKKILFLIILLMSIGFATVSTTLIINGITNVKENKEDFEIIFTKANLDNKNVYNEIVSEDKKSITFTSNDLIKINDISVLIYEVTNNSKNYDAEVKINCRLKDEKISEYTSITNVLNTENNIIKAKESAIGTLIITLNKKSVESITEKYVCTLEFNAVERTSLGIEKIDLYNLIETNADKNTTIDFSVRSGATGQETNGIYTTTNTDSGKEVYYYRGNADNNIIYNNMCWKIIRTTETGGVKLIYNGKQADGKCSNTGEDSTIGTSAFNTSYTDNASVGYMYGSAGSSTYAKTHTNTNDSTIKTYIDNWFSANFDESAQSKLEDTVFCNDRNTKAYDANLIGDNSYSSYGTLGYAKQITIYESTFRASYDSKTPNPTLVCKNTNGTVDEFNDSFTVSKDSGNGKLTYPVGLITLDEAIYAGFNTNASNASDYNDMDNYLNISKWYWTISPIAMRSDGGADVGFIYGDGSIKNDNVRHSFYVRPVLSLKSGIKIYESGSGTEEEPYIVVE